MSERKVLSKYYPPDFDPSAITRVRGPKQTGPKVQPVRLMAPFSMKCVRCGEYIYKGRKFNARKETTDEKYLNITIFRFYIRCTRCSAEITFKTDPKNMDYECERGARRNFEIWRQTDGQPQETDEERLDRLEQEQAEQDAMGALEGKMVDAKREMAIADALDELHARNLRHERTAKQGDDTLTASVVAAPSAQELERIRQEEEDAELARKAFEARVPATKDDEDEGALLKPKTDAESITVPTFESTAELAEDSDRQSMPPPPKPPAVTFKKGTKRKKDFGAALGIKKKPALV